MSARDDLLSQSSPLVAVRRMREEGGLVPGRRSVTHTYAVLAFCTGGEARMDLRGEWELREGDALLVPAGEPHRLLAVRGVQVWGLGFCVPCFASERAAMLLEPFERVREGASAVVHIPAARRAFLTGLLGELENRGDEPRSRSDTLDAVQRSLLTLILAEVDEASRACDVPRAVGGSVVTSALRFIERNCLRQLTLADVAAAVGRSPAHVTTALTRATGRSAGHWIVSGRMAEARRLLLHSSESIDTVAQRVGYADTTHFIRMFRREHGATPAAWRVERTRSNRDA